MASQLMTVTEAAAEQIKSLMTEQNFSTLRIGVTATGCSGLSYVMEPAEAQDASDVIIEDKGVKLVVDMKSQLYMAGMELDWYETQFESGFVFNNPMSKGSCGCGKSFKV